MIVLHNLIITNVTRGIFMFDKAFLCIDTSS
jgi:hypothetical protein